MRGYQQAPPSPQPSPLAGERGFCAATTTTPALLLQRGVQSPPLKKGDLGGFEVFTVKPAATATGLLKANRYKAELEELCQKISAATGVKLALEGVYRWLCFMPSKQDPKRPVATRYFGVFEDGSLKVRGIACRRRDTPPFVRRAQEALLAKLAEAVTPDDLMALKPELEEMAAGFRRRLREGRVRPQDLVITRVLSQTVADYKVDTPTALAARQLAGRGHPFAAGREGALRPRREKGRPQGDAASRPRPSWTPWTTTTWGFIWTCWKGLSRK